MNLTIGLDFIIEFFIGLPVGVFLLNAWKGTIIPGIRQMIHNKAIDRKREAAMEHLANVDEMNRIIREHKYASKAPRETDATATTSTASNEIIWRIPADQRLKPPGWGNPKFVIWPDEDNPGIQKCQIGDKRIEVPLRPEVQFEEALRDILDRAGYGK